MSGCNHTFCMGMHSTGNGLMRSMRSEMASHKNRGHRETMVLQTVFTKRLIIVPCADKFPNGLYPARCTFPSAKKGINILLFTRPVRRRDHVVISKLQSPDQNYIVPCSTVVDLRIWWMVRNMCSQATISESIKL